MNFDQRNAISNPADGLMVFCLDCGVDGSFSFYSNGTWKTFAPCSCFSPVEGINVISPGQIIWNWNTVYGATGYKWNTTNNFSSAIDMGTVCSKTETGIVSNTDYTRYVWSYNSCSNSIATILTESTIISVPPAPLTGTHAASWNQIVWNWNTSVDATGYKWNTVNNYSTSEDLFASTTKTETGLTCGTANTSYVWAYNGYGHSTPTTLSKTTLSCSSCGTSITINHVAGDVAPVTKSVTYNTIGNVPGEPSKCWITSNLGASHQATAVSDTTEASAGWYWQFNLAQGYKHDGTTRTPNTTWIISINEYSNWVLTSDPCALELGGTWRIPTNTEYSNVDASGGWTNWNGPFGSALKMHAAGNLNASTGIVQLRGTVGFYWNSNQGLTTTGRNLYFLSGACQTTTGTKASGYSLRCIKD